MSLEEYIASLKAYRGFSGEIVAHRVVSPREAVFAPAKSCGLDHDPAPFLSALGIDRLFAHQHQAISMITRGIHTVVATPTASGKSLIYNLPVIDSLVTDPKGTALYLFPLKALARDQLATIQHLLDRAGSLDLKAPALRAGVYDGDISAYQKAKIRKSPPHVLLSNPEMLHLAMLAHHHLWENFFSRLKYVVIDEVHTYRGVMGSNMAWVFRRLLRICRFYGADPVFIFCSATIANPGSLASALTGLEVSVVDRQGAPSGEKNVMLMRGTKGAAQTAITLIHAAVHRNLRTIIYTQSRKITELIAIWASQRARPFAEKITAYRAGFLPEERRDIEKRLATGELLAVVSTSALELGIDIGSLDLCILVGYPGTIMSTWQRAGRVGRGGKPSAMVLIAHEDALDQYFVNHPDIFFSMDPEMAIINPENQMILDQHLSCAAAELSLKQGEAFLEENLVRTAVADLEYRSRLLRSHDGKVWYSPRKAPHREVSLRGTGRTVPIFLADTKQSLGEIDLHRSYFETHEGAVYLHRGKSHVVTLFDHEKRVVEARQKDVNYYTRARSSKSTRIIRCLDTCRVGSSRMGYGILKISEQVTGYDRKLVSSGKSLGIVPLDLPCLEFETQGLWIEVGDRIRDEMESRYLHFMGGIHALEHAAIGIMPLLVMTDRNDLGGISTPFHDQVGRAAVFIYDGMPGGMGLSLQAFERADILVKRTFEAISSCPCESGCPACVHSPKCGSGNRPIDKFAAGTILEMILAGIFKDEVSGNFSPAETDWPESGPTKTSPPVPAPESQSVMEIARDAPYGAGKYLRAEKASQTMTKEGCPSVSSPLRFGVLDIETRRSANEVGGWNRAHRMGVSCAVLYDSLDGIFHTFFQEDMEQLLDHLLDLDLVIGFNILRFDYKVLSGLSSFDFDSLPTLDLLTMVHKQLGYRISLDHLAQQTLGERKTADGLMALKWWKEGKMDKIVKYCTQDVKVTRDLYLFARKKKYLLFKNKAGHHVRVPVRV